MTISRSRIQSVMLHGISLTIAAACLGLPAQAKAPTMAMLDGLEKGAWQVRFRGGSQERRLCVRTGRELIQIHHPGQRCNRYVVEDGQNELTVQYKCSGTGYGRTSIRKENARLVQLSGQGIAGSRPFQFSAEARRVGACR